MGKPKDPDYWKKWRAAHPEYKAREKERRKRKRATQGREDRSEEYRRRTAKKQAARAAQEALEAVEDPMVIEAKRYVSRWVQKDRRTAVASDYYDECVAEVLLSMAMGQSKSAGLGRARRARLRWAEKHWTGRLAPGQVDVLALRASGPAVFGLAEAED